MYEQKRLIKEQRLAKEQRRGNGAHMHVHAHADADVQQPGARPPGKKQRPSDSRTGSGRGGETFATVATPAAALPARTALPALAALAPPPTATPRGCCALSPLRTSGGAPPPRAKPSITGVRHPPAGSVRQLRTSSSELLALNTGSGAQPEATTPTASSPPLPTLRGLRTSASMPGRALRL